MSSLSGKVWIQTMFYKLDREEISRDCLGWENHDKDVLSWVVTVNWWFLFFKRNHSRLFFTSFIYHFRFDPSILVLSQVFFCSAVLGYS